VQQSRRVLSQAALEDQARHVPAPPQLRLHESGFDLIAELKLRSPAAGTLRAGTGSVSARVSAYARAGAAAISVLTEPSRFDGTLAHLAEAARALRPLGVPALRKDFLVDPYQVIEARAAGAGGVLLILRMLARQQLTELLDCAAAYGLFVLLEAFDAPDIERLSALVGAYGTRNRLLAGVNCRDLGTLEVVPQRLTELAPLLPPGVPRVAESGVSAESEAASVAAAGYELVLVGSALMRDDDPEGLAGALLAAGRSAARRRRRLPGGARGSPQEDQP
jgi:indole-3-glycerol phosphate synthase